MEQQQKTRRWLWLGAAAALACTGGIGPKGDPGDTGPAGQNGLVAVAPEAAGSNCSGGGLVVRSGLDTNGNGTLDSGEVANTSYVCNGSPDTAAQVMAKVQTVDGAGSGLDADLLQGQPLSTVAPPGTVVAFAGPSGRVPTGWFLCDGRAISRTTYASLFTAIGVFHGIGDGTTTFNIPDYRGRFLRGVAYTATLDPDRNARTVIGAGTGVVSNEVGSVQGAATGRPTSAFTTNDPGNHSHTNGNFSRILQVTSGGSNTFGTGDATAGEPDLINSASMLSAGAHTHSITGGGDNETRPANAYVNYIIKI